MKISHIFSLLFSASTAFHALELGFRTVLVDDCSRGIDEIDIKNSFERIRAQNGLVVQSHEVRFKEPYTVREVTRRKCQI